MSPSLSRRRTPSWAGAAALCVLAGCADDPTRPTGTVPPPAAPKVLGVVEVTITGIGGPNMSVSTRPVSPGGPDGGPRLALSPPANGDGSGDGSLQFQSLSTGTVTEGARGAGGVRYVWTTLRVRNAQSNGTPYDTPRQNLTMVPVATSTSIPGTPIGILRRPDGTNADPAIATQIVPAGLVGRNARGELVSQDPDILQAFTESEVSAVPLSAGITDIFPYGYVVTSLASSVSRTLPASPAADQSDGVLTIGLKVPLQPTFAEDALTISILLLAMEDSETRITQSLEEQTPAGKAALEARAAALSATTVTLLPGGAYDGPAATRTLCNVRTAGSAAAPIHVLAPCVPSVVVTPPFSTVLVGQTQQLTAAVSDGAAPIPGAPVAWSSSDSAVATVDSAGLVTVHAAGTATITATSSGASGSATVQGEQLVPQTLAAGLSHSCGLTPSGAAYCWGRNQSGQLGTGSFTDSSVPVAVGGGLAFGSIAAGHDHTVAITPAGRVYAWGRNLSGILGVERISSYVSLPSPARDVGSIAFRQVDAGNGFTVALTADGVLYAWGVNASGQLGDSTTTTRSAPVPVKGGLTFRAVDAGASHVVAVTTSGEAYGWGLNGDGQLGDGTRTSRTAPTRAQMPSGVWFHRISAGHLHTVALTPAGVPYAWGAAGQTGTGTASGYVLAPAPVLGGLTFAQVSAGADHTVVLTAAGQAYAWGSNAQGALGTGTAGSQAAPAAVSGGLTFAQVAAGAYHNVGVTAAGAAHAWGLNVNGQLGDGTTTQRDVPTAVSGGLTFSAP